MYNILLYTKVLIRNNIKNVYFLNPIPDNFTNVIRSASISKVILKCVGNL